MRFAAVHMSAFGRKQTYRGEFALVRFRREADIQGRGTSITSVADDPKQTSPQ